MEGGDFYNEHKSEIERITDEVLNYMRSERCSKVMAQKYVLRYNFGNNGLSQDEYRQYCSSISRRMNELKKLKGVRPETEIKHETPIVRDDKRKLTRNWWDETRCSNDVEALVVSELVRGVDDEALQEIGY